MQPPIPQLLVSVRSVAEMQQAIAGGADIIDVKEPTRGALGRADAATLTEVATRGRQFGVRWMSAAFGELLDFDRDDGRVSPEFCFVKLGTAGLAGLSEAKSKFLDAASGIRAMTGESVCVVPAAYADWPRANAPHPSEVLAWAMEAQGRYLLVDTFVKDGRGFWDHLSQYEYESLRRQCRECGLRLAIAGSLDADAIARFQGSPPEVIGIRGAACEGGSRHHAISPDRVRDIKAALRSLGVDVVQQTMARGACQPP